jgi:hypothetical protein
MAVSRRLRHVVFDIKINNHAEHQLEFVLQISDVK